MLGGGAVRSVLHGSPQAVPAPAAFIVVRSEEITGSLGGGVMATDGSVRITEAVDPNGAPVWLVARRQDIVAAADIGASLNGTGSQAEVSGGGGTTAVWAFGSLEDARAAAALSLTVLTTPALGLPSIVMQHRVVRAGLHGPLATAAGSMEITQERRQDGAAALTMAATAGTMPALPAVLGSLPAGARTLVRIEAPTDSSRARVIVSVTTDRQTPTGSGLSILDAANREIERSTTTATFELTDPDDVQEARDLASSALGTASPDDLVKAARLASRAGPVTVTVERGHAVGVIRHVDASASLGVGASGGLGVETWQTTG